MEYRDLSLLQALVAVGETSNFRQAAEKLKISQPAVSQKLKELESQQPFPLFSWKGRRKELSTYGQALFECARRQLRQMDEELQQVKRHFDEPANLSLRIAGRVELLSLWMKQIDFAGELHLKDMSSADAIRALEQREVDLALSHFRPDSTELIAKRVLTSHQRLVVHRSRLGKGSLTLSKAQSREFLTQQPCVVYGDPVHFLLPWLQDCGVKLGEVKIRYRVEDWGLVQQLVQGAHGFALVPSYLAWDPEVEILDLPRQIAREKTFFLLYEKSLKKIPSFQKLLESPQLESP
ncbi:MAG: LysR substrate-binding domain-containing protein [Bdellovibrionales bacterium]